MSDQPVPPPGQPPPSSSEMTAQAQQQPSSAPDGESTTQSQPLLQPTQQSAPREMSNNSDGNSTATPTEYIVMNDGYDPVPNGGLVAPPLDPTQQPTIPVPDVQPISADEVALYDRQIRLWGMKAQEKIRGANLLLVGMKALGNEIAKNLVLAGIGTLTILEHEVVMEEDLGSQFFVAQESVGQNRALAAQSELQKLNPRVNLFIDPDIVLTKMPEYFSTFDITIATGLQFDALSQINMSCRMFNRKFYAAETHGMYGYIFADLILHDFVVEKEKSNKSSKPGDIESSTRSVISVVDRRENDKPIEVVTKQEIYSPLLLANSSPLPLEINRNRRSRMKVPPLLSCFRALFDFQRQRGGHTPGHNRQDLELFARLANEKHLELALPIETLRAEFLRSFLQNLDSELSPVVAFLGGRLAQDVINVLGQREQPLQNFLLFDGEEFKGPVYGLHPIFDDAMSMPMDGMNGVPMDAGTGMAVANGNPVPV